MTELLQQINFDNINNDLSGNKEITLELPFAKIDINSELERKVIQMIGNNSYSIIQE